MQLPASPIIGSDKVILFGEGGTEVQEMLVFSVSMQLCETTVEYI